MVLHNFRTGGVGIDGGAVYVYAGQSADGEKMIAIERLRDNRTGVVNRKFKKYQFLDALKDPLMYYAFFYTISCVVPNSGASFVSILPRPFQLLTSMTDR